jgi:hypothetical protein
MNIEQTIEAIRVMQAYVDGKEVEFKWMSMDWNSTDKTEWNWSAYDYRIKPTATLRPWTADEVPLGAWIRFKDKPQDRHLLGWVSGQADRDMWLDEREHSIDNGKTWLPCGVMEESK